MAVKGPVLCTTNEIISLNDGRRRLSRGGPLECPLTNLVDIDLVFSVNDEHDLATKRRLQSFAEEVLRTLENQKCGFSFFKQQCLVFGNCKVVLKPEDLKSCLDSDPHCLHFFTKLSDFKRLEVTSNKSLVKGLIPDKTLTDTTVDSSKHLCSNNKQESRLVLRGSVVEQGKDPTPSTIECVDGDPIVHLVIRKSTNIQCYRLKEQKEEEDKEDSFEIKVSAGTTVEEVKSKIEELTDGFQAHEHKVIKEGLTLHPGTSLADLGVKKGDILELVQVPLCLEEYHDSGVGSHMSPQSEMPFEWEKAKDALAHGVRPKLSSAGTGGSYFISALEGKNLAVFKPQDEEPLAPNNPKGHKGCSLDRDGLRRGVRPGEGAVREVIAFTLDHEHFAGVPPTTMVTLSDKNGRILHKKVGSFQQFVPHDMDCEEMGPSKFPVKEVHKICVLDIRLANTDRNGGNILAREVNGQWQLTPIDHGYCLPDSFADINFEWIYWRQAKVPFDKATIEYINLLDARKDLKKLARNGLCLRPECARVFLVCTMLLKKAIVFGLTPQQLGLIMCREASRMSPLEKLHKQAMHFTLFKAYGENNLLGKEKYLGSNETVYLETMSSLLDQYLEETQTV